MVAALGLQVPADTPCLIESKSLKLYLNSFNGTRFDDAASVRARIAEDLSRRPRGAVSGVAGRHDAAGASKIRSTASPP